MVVELNSSVVGIVFFFQAEDGIRDLVRSRGLGDVYKRQVQGRIGSDQIGKQHSYFLCPPYPEKCELDDRCDFENGRSCLPDD